MPEPGSDGRCSTSHASRSRRARQLDHLEAQARARERSAVGAQRLARPGWPAAPSRRPPRGRWRSRWSPAPRPRGRARRACPSPAGSRGGSRGPSRRCSAPRRSPAARPRPRTAGSMSSRKRGLFSRSGLISSRSIVPAASSPRTSSHSSRLVLLTVCARSPSRSAAAIWLRISASSGLMISVGPAPASRSSAVATKYTADLPHPVRWTQSTRARSATRSLDRLELVRAELRRRLPCEGAQAVQGGGRRTFPRQRWLEA